MCHIVTGEDRGSYQAHARDLESEAVSTSTLIDAMASQELRTVQVTEEAVEVLAGSAIEYRAETLGLRRSQVDAECDADVSIARLRSQSHHLDSDEGDSPTATVEIGGLDGGK